MASDNSKCREGREHLMFSALSAGDNRTELIALDWCVRCGIYDPNANPHIVIKGKRREVEDVTDVQGLLG